MADLRALILTEDNDETVAITVNRMYLADDLMQVGQLELYLKDADCDADADAHRLTSTDPTQIKILTQTSAQITAEAYIPGTWLVGAYPRFYHVDALTSGARRSAIYGPVTVNNI